MYSDSYSPLFDKTTHPNPVVQNFYEYQNRQTPPVPLPQQQKHRMLFGTQPLHPTTYTDTFTAVAQTVPTVSDPLD